MLAPDVFGANSGALSHPSPCITTCQLQTSLPQTPLLAMLRNHQTQTLDCLLASHLEPMETPQGSWVLGVGAGFGES